MAYALLVILLLAGAPLIAACPSGAGAEDKTINTDEVTGKLTNPD